MLKRLWIAFKFRHMTRAYDRMIAAARRRHMPVRHIQAAKQAWLHSILARKLP